MGDDQPATASEAQALRATFLSLSTRDDLAAFLGVKGTHLRILLGSSTGLDSAYRRFLISKKAGGMRVISAPSGPLRAHQRKIATALQLVHDPRLSTHGYVHDRSIHTNAREHVAPRYLLNVDLKEFFPSIHFGRVFGMFRSRPFEFPDEVARSLAQLACFEGALPIGAPTSPAISNTICFGMDGQLQRLAGRAGARYTRYADDLTFSTMRKRFPRSLAAFSEAGETIVGDSLREVIAQNGFQLNDSKSRLRTPFQRQEVTGITVNERPNVPRSFIRNIRSMLYNWEVDGYEQCQADMERKYRRDRLPLANPQFGDVLLGRLSYVGAVRGTDDDLYRRLAQRFMAQAAVDPVTPEHIAKWKVPELKESKVSLLQRRERGGVFVSYSHHDEGWLNDFKTRLAPLIRDEKLRLWDDSKIRAGDEFEAKILAEILECRLALLIISANFFASNYVIQIELPRILKRAHEEGVRILCLIVGHSRYMREPDINRFQALNDPGRPLEALPPAAVSQALQAAADEIEDLLAL